MVDINTVFGSFMKAADLGGRDVPLTVSEFSIEKFDDGTKPCLKFHGAEKGLLLNKTNSNTIAGLYGNETDHWIGKQVVLYSTKVDFRGQMVDAIRVKGPAVPVPAPAPAVPPPGDADFLDL